MSRKYKSILALILMSLLFAPSVRCAPSTENPDDDPAIYSDAYFDDRFDFTALVKIYNLKNYLTYKGSTLNPVGLVSVSYRYHPREHPENALPVTKYEDLWYHDFTPIGCRRYRDLPAQPGSFGCIRLLRSAAAADYPGAVANAAIRLLLDLNLHGCACQDLIVPSEIMGEVFSAFSHFGFYENTTQPEHIIPGHILVTLQSDPPGTEKRLYFPDR